MSTRGANRPKSGGIQHQCFTGPRGIRSGDELAVTGMNDRWPIRGGSHLRTNGGAQLQDVLNLAAPIDPATCRVLGK